MVSSRGQKFAHFHFHFILTIIYNKPEKNYADKGFYVHDHPSSCV